MQAPHIHIVPLAHGYMEYLVEDEHYSHTAGCKVTPSHYMRTVDYKDVVDACIDDLPEGKFL